MLDSSFLLTLGIIFLVAMVGSYLNGRRRDPCLKDLDGFHVTVEKKNGRIIWGNVRVFSSGIELEYSTNVQDEAHIETSYLMYKEEYKDVQAIYRYADELSPAQQARRARDLRRSFHPGPCRILSRKLRNFTNTASDSLAEALGYVTGRARQKQQTAALSETGENYLKKLGKDLIGHVGTSFDPLMENYVGAKVVAEVLEGEVVQEYVGVLKDYSTAFIEILNVLYPQSLSISLATQEEREKLARNIRITFDGDFHIQNLSQYPLLLHEMECGDRESEINAVIGPGDTVHIQPLALNKVRTREKDALSVFFRGTADENDGERSRPLVDADGNGIDDLFEQALQRLTDSQYASENVQFNFRVIRLLDMVLPRAHSLIRHKAERYNPNQVFGNLSLPLRFLKRQADLEMEYRKALRGKPSDAPSAVGLARVLLQRGELAEAVVFLELALEHRDKLVDHGRLAELQLQMTHKKLQSRQGKIAD